MIPIDLSDAFAICRHNKIKAILPDDTRLILERHHVSAQSFDQYHYTLNVKQREDEHYAATTFTGWPKLADMLSITYHASPFDEIWLPIEASFPAHVGAEHVTAK